MDYPSGMAVAPTRFRKELPLAMNAKIHKPEWQRIEIWLLWGAVFATLLLFLASSTT
jgi:hypothetical protein